MKIGGYGPALPALFTWCHWWTSPAHFVFKPQDGQAAESMVQNLEWLLEDRETLKANPETFTPIIQSVLYSWLFSFQPLSLGLLLPPSHGYPAPKSFLPPAPQPKSSSWKDILATSVQVYSFLPPEAFCDLTLALLSTQFLLPHVLLALDRPFSCSSLDPLNGFTL